MTELGLLDTVNGHGLPVTAERTHVAVQPTDIAHLAVSMSAASRSSRPAGRRTSADQHCVDPDQAHQPDETADSVSRSIRLDEFGE